MITPREEAINCAREDFNELLVNDRIPTDEEGLPLIKPIDRDGIRIPDDTHAHLSSLFGDHMKTCLISYVEEWNKLLSEARLDEEA